MEPLWILIAFMLGFAASQVGLPPLVGYLAAGFVLNHFGVETGHVIEEVADIGVLLLLFSIGLKLKLRSLAKPEVWAGASLHMLVIVGLFTALLWGGAVLLFSAQDPPAPSRALVIAFALSFSSTVFAVKTLEERGEMAAIHGRIAIGILIMQDIFAVLFLTFSTGKFPSPWALAVPLLLFAVRPVLMRILDRCGHRELLLLFGLFLALGLGAGGFEMVSLKGDLGALALGVLIAGHPKATELSEALLSLKDLFLVGFFLNIGLSGPPTLQAFGVAGLLILVVPIKALLFFFLLTRFRLRARTALMTSFNLANYSEFGLLVALIGVRNGWMTDDWMTIIALALSISFVVASLLNSRVHAIYTRYCVRLRRFETSVRHPGDKPIDPGDADILIFGMGRLGAGAYDNLRTRYGGRT
ncbi:MAG: potassium transporter Kef, partial [Desulfobacterales bacterium]|nr:potassium transporter Kef [Desulfobacterales bacterium]